MTTTLAADGVATAVPMSDRFHRTFGPISVRYLSDDMLGTYVGVHCVARAGRVTGYLRALGERVDATWEPADGKPRSPHTTPRPPVRHAILEVAPGTYAQAWVDLDQQATLFDCRRCEAQMFHGWGGPAHEPQPTCRMGGRTAHCTCAGCW